MYYIYINIYGAFRYINWCCFMYHQCLLLSSLQHILLFFVQLLVAIDHVHKLNILHRDLKTQNVMFNRKSNSLKIWDFGISIVLSSKITSAKTVFLWLHFTHASELSLRKTILFKSASIINVEYYSIAFGSHGIFSYIEINWEKVENSYYMYRNILYIHYCIFNNENRMIFFLIQSTQ